MSGVRCIDPDCWADSDDIVTEETPTGVVRRCNACLAEWRP